MCPACRPRVLQKVRAMRPPTAQLLNGNGLRAQAATASRKVEELRRLTKNEIFAVLPGKD